MPSGSNLVEVTRKSRVALASKALSHVSARQLVPVIAWQYRFFEPELKRLREFVPASRGAVDVGVWWGPWSWWLARWVPRVDSFEANAELATKVAGGMPSNVTLHPVALSDQSGSADLWIPSGGTGTEGRSSIEPSWTHETGGRQQSVKTRRLDDFDLGNVGFVKIDVEGHELAVLHGAIELIRDQRPTLLIEIESQSHVDDHMETILEFLRERSYRGRFLQKGRWHPIEKFDRRLAREMAARTARHGYPTNLLLYSRRYIHNFVFVPDETA